MVHLFSFGLDHLAFDSESGALHQLDELGASVLQAYVQTEGHRPDAQAMAALSDRFGDAAVLETCAEIDQIGRAHV